MPIIDSESREAEIINAAYDLAEKQIREGTASSQVITHFLKAGSQRMKLETERLRHETENLKAKTRAIENADDSRRIAEEAIAAMKRYGGMR